MPLINSRFHITSKTKKNIFDGPTFSFFEIADRGDNNDEADD